MPSFPLITYMHQASETEITLSEWIFFLFQVLLNFLGIWLAIVLYFHQQRQSQDKRYEEIVKSLESLDSQLDISSRDIWEIKAQTAQIDKTISQSMVQILDKAVTQVIKTADDRNVDFIFTTYGVQLPNSNLDKPEPTEEG